MDTDLSGKTYVISGATSGIGLELAQAINRSGGTVIGIGRSRQRCQEVETRLRNANPQAAAVYLTTDLSLQHQVRMAAAQVREVLGGQGKTWLDGLVNNAATFTYWMTLTAEGFETQWAVNYLAAFLLTHELLPFLLAAPAGRVVTVSSDSHYGVHLNWDDIQLRRNYSGLRAYGQTKLAGVLFSLELKRRLAQKDISLGIYLPTSQTDVRQPLGVYAADPGLVKTDIGLKGTPPLVRWIWNLRRSRGIAPAESAQGILRLLTDPDIQGAQQVYWKEGRPKPPSREGLEPGAARQLWALSERMCGLPSSEVAA